MHSRYKKHICNKKSSQKSHSLKWVLSVSLFALFTFSLSSSAFLQDSSGSISSAYECTQVALDGVDEALLTKQERIALLDESLSASIDSYSTCVSTVAQTMSGGGAGGGSGEGDSGAGTSGANKSAGEQVGDSTNSDNQQSAAQTQGISDISSEQAVQVPQGANSSQGVGSTSAARGIIPPKNNDKIICKLLYQEITKTQDPDMLNGLRQQYSNYKCGT